MAQPHSRPSATILEILQAQNPSLIDKSKPGSVSRNVKWLVIKPENVQPWSSFTYDKVVPIHRDALDLVVEKPQVYPEGLSKSQREIRNEADVDRVSDLASGVIRRPLKVIYDYLAKDQSPDKHITFRVHSKLNTIRAPSPKTGRMMVFRPDLAILLHEPDAESDESRELLVAGDNKNGKAFNSQDLETFLANTTGPGKKAIQGRAKAKNPNENTNLLWPLAQAATYAHYGGTRYAFIFTQFEVMAIRISTTPSPGGVEPIVHIEYKFVPYDASGNDVMTVNLAIVCLAMMALQDRNALAMPASPVSPMSLRHIDVDGRHGDSLDSLEHQPPASRRRRGHVAASFPSQPAQKSNEDFFPLNAEKSGNTGQRRRRRGCSGKMSTPKPARKDQAGVPRQQTTAAAAAAGGASRKRKRCGEEDGEQNAPVKSPANKTRQRARAPKMSGRSRKC